LKESATSKEIKEYLDLNQLINWRNNVLTGFFRPSKKVKEYWIISGTPGLSDRSCLLPNGQTIYIEVKKPSGGKQLETQKDFEKDCIKNNVPYIIARSSKDVSDFFRAYFGGTEYYHRFIYL